jgi:(R,R)-butanediol dehydrogenase/meso-butanediol dehydrogenase/diacetyl reductase
MKRVVFKGVGIPLAVEQAPDPTPGAGEAVIRVARCGVCGTDVHSTAGHGYTIPVGGGLGHEYAGEVVAVGSGVEGLRLGDQVASMPFSGCGACAACQTGFFYFCDTKKSYSQGLAQYAVVGARSCVKLPSTVGVADGALVEPLAVARKAVRVATLAPEQRILVYGPGPIGLGVVFWARHAGARNIVMVSRSRRREAMARAMGAEHVLREEEATPEAIQALLGGAPDVVFECVGMPNILQKCIEQVRRQGLVVSLGFCTQPDAIVPAKAMMKDITLRFSVTYDLSDFQACADALERDADRARAMVTQTASLAEFADVFEALREGGNQCKVLLDPWVS